MLDNYYRLSQATIFDYLRQLSQTLLENYLRQSRASFLDGLRQLSQTILSEYLKLFMATNLDNLKQLFLTILCNYLDYLRLSYLRLSQSTILDNPSQLSHTIKDYLRIYETFIPDFLRQLSKTTYQSILNTYLRLSKTNVLFFYLYCNKTLDNNKTT